VVFFQAEDGIRGKLVTGVQTCALPIYDERRRHPPGEGVYGSWSALARWAPFGSCGGRVRRVDGGDARHRQLPPLSDLVADVHHGPARGADEGRSGNPFHARGHLRWLPRRARHPHRLSALLVTDE